MVRQNAAHHRQIVPYIVPEHSSPPSLGWICALHGIVRSNGIGGGAAKTSAQVTEWAKAADLPTRKTRHLNFDRAEPTMAIRQMSSRSQAGFVTRAALAAEG
jgi:hypothetical protein